MSPSENERLARLEEWRNSQDDDGDRFREDLHALKMIVVQINQRLAKQTGFFAGIAFCIGAVWAVIAAFIEAIVRNRGVH
jgi:hypothetical protein